MGVAIARYWVLRDMDCDDAACEHVALTCADHHTISEEISRTPHNHIFIGPFRKFLAMAKARAKARPVASELAPRPMLYAT